MEKRFIADELIKVANVLDDMGLTKEANSVDRIARKIVVSENDSLYNIRNKSDAKLLEERFINLLFS